MDGIRDIQTIGSRTETTRNNTLSFRLGAKTMFEAKVNSSTVAYLQGTTLPIPETVKVTAEMRVKDK